MTKREKAVLGLECCIKHNPDDKSLCAYCPYKDPETCCFNILMEDALELLKGGEGGCNGDYCEIN